MPERQHDMPHEDLSSVQNCLLACLDALVPGGCPRELVTYAVQNRGNMNDVAELISLSLYHSGFIPDLQVVTRDTDLANVMMQGSRSVKQSLPSVDRTESVFFGVLFQTSDRLVRREVGNGPLGSDDQIDGVVNLPDIPVELHVVAAIPITGKSNMYTLIDTLHSHGPRVEVDISRLDWIKDISNPLEMKGVIVSGYPLGSLSQLPEHQNRIDELSAVWAQLTRSE